MGPIFQTKSNNRTGSVSQAVKTLPFHGGSMGSNPIPNTSVELR